MNERADSDLQSLSRDLKIPLEVVESVVQLLDEGNTTAFIARFRRDQTKGLSEPNVLAIKRRVVQLRALAERKTIILKSIESQGALSEALATQINEARSSKRLEDLYLPFKPKKQSLATIARQKGLEPLAREIFEGAAGEDELAQRAREFVRVDKGLNDIDDVMKGVGHLLAERFSENIDLRSRLRKLLWKTGKLTSQLVTIPEVAESATENQTPGAVSSVTAPQLSATTDSADVTTSSSVTAPEIKNDSATNTESSGVEAKNTNALVAEMPKDVSPASKSDGDSPPVEVHVPLTENDEETATSPSNDNTDSSSAPTNESVDSEQAELESPSSTGEVQASNAGSMPATTTESTVDPPPKAEDSTGPEKLIAVESSGKDAVSAERLTEELSGDVKSQIEAETPSIAATANNTATVDAAAEKAGSATGTKPKKKKKKKKASAKKQNPFADYANFSESVNKVPPHRVLALNRGERAKKLRVKIVADDAAIRESAIEMLVPPEHTCHEFLKKCAIDSLNRLIFPSLEREIRRELSDRSERHALEVFGRNLSSLLFQPPVGGRQILAIDPGYRGCRAAVIDKSGKLLGHDVIQLVGNETRRLAGRQKIVELVKTHGVNIIAIGNGSACRQAEQLVSTILEEDLPDTDLRYVIVNEAGTSAYSTSEVGREELADCEPVVRSAISIGRRLMDPMSELVKVNPANLGVGLYQHDIKAKHLAEALDEAVASCVNHVGVDVNTASPALLKYVSGLSQLTARRLFEYRQEHGPFRNRQDFKKVAGFGDQTFQQAAGFLRINDGDNPLDATAIHPESYSTATALLEKLGFTCDDLVSKPAPSSTDEPSPPAKDEVAESSLKTPSAELSPEARSAAASQEESAKPTAKTAASESLGSDDAATPASEVSLPTESSVVPVVSTTTTPDPIETKVDAIETSTDLSAPKPDATIDKPEPALQVNRQKEISEQLAKLDKRKLAAEFNVGEMLMQYIAEAIDKPGRDPREESAQPIFRKGIIKIENLEPNIQLRAQVLNVVDFGVFVDIGLGESSLIHISRLSNGYVSDPHQLFSTGDTLDVWVTEIDRERRRVTLTAVPPGTKPPERKRGQYHRKKPASAGKPDTRKKRYSKKHTPKAGSVRERPRRKPARPAPPITKEMVEGKEAMRSFSDLAQFFEKKTTDDDKE